MNEILPGQGGAFEVKDDALVRVEGTQDVPAPLPPTATPVEPAAKRERGTIGHRALVAVNDKNLSKE